MANLNLEIISPAGVLFKGTCYMAVIPSVEGEMGVMNNHEAVIANLQTGVISIFDEKQNLIKSFEVESGFAESSVEKLLILLD
jgi:F-type H+-transporting ATPase subunit epsilon